jgi:glycolate oxidase
LVNNAAVKLFEASERLFWVTKVAGAHNILNVVVPRSCASVLLEGVICMAQQHETFIGGCGYMGYGNVHFSVFPVDDERRDPLPIDLFAFGLGFGGATSGEHEIGRDKQGPYLALTDPALVGLQRRVKQVLDPRQLLNPYQLIDERPTL